VVTAYDDERQRALHAAQQGDRAAFDQLVGPHRSELLAHCYRMLGSPHDAEDALQEALLGAWRGIAGFGGRSSLRTWLFRITTNACLRQASRRPKRVLTPDYGPACRDPSDLGEPVRDPIWLEPMPDLELLAEPGVERDPAADYLRRESVELAYVAALQHLPVVQRAALVLREVMGFSAAEVAQMLDTTPAAVNSALQRARKTVAERAPAASQQQELAALGTDGRRRLVDAFVAAWERSDVPALLELLTEDVRFTMPPLPAWFDGRDSVSSFMTERMFVTEWRLRPLRANAQVGFGCYTRERGVQTPYGLGAVNLLSIRSGRVDHIHAFIDPGLIRSLGLDDEIG
jgi:RNA polymerase sigma-70 factor (ECF subfamily)